MRNAVGQSPIRGEILAALLGQRARASSGKLYGRKRNRPRLASERGPGMLKSRADAERVRNECKEMVTQRALVSGGASAVPVPAADAVVDVAILMAMIPEISRRFELSPEQIGNLPPSMQPIVYSLIKRTGMALAGKVVTQQVIVRVLRTVGTRVAVKQVARYVPFIGTAVSAAIGFGAMKYVGDRHVDDCFEVCVRLLESVKAVEA